MPRFISTFSVVILLCFPILAQRTEKVIHESEPQGGITQLALVYYKIDFTVWQRQMLDSASLELIIEVDKKGKATLEKVNGINDPAIIDSLKNKTALHPFNPRTVDGLPESSLYFMKFSFPKYESRSINSNSLYYPHYKRVTLEDLEYVHKSGRKLYVVIGGLMNSFAGNAAEHLALGGGMKVEMFLKGTNAISYGLVMDVYGNKLKKKYSLNTTRDQEAAPATMLIGLAGNVPLSKKERSELNLQLDLCYAIQNISARQTNNDKDYIQAWGFSPGIVLNYLVQLGKDKFSHYYGNPTLFSHHVNLHGAIRPLFLDLKQASGILLEVGVSYRLDFDFIDEYKLK